MSPRCLTFHIAYLRPVKHRAIREGEFTKLQMNSGKSKWSSSTIGVGSCSIGTKSSGGRYENLGNLLPFLKISNV